MASMEPRRYSSVQHAILSATQHRMEAAIIEQVRTHVDNVRYFKMYQPPNAEIQHSVLVAMRSGHDD